ncbi:MAG: dihydropteroate synthase [Lachnospiraceae bacterium]|nr:dihydropteroate synthase [Lachnospiraceae bacterium]
MRIKDKEFDTDNRTYVMGILNVTPDSFSDGGKWNNMDKALSHVEEMIRDGADIIDIGGESTRPGYVRISDEEETERTAKVVEAVAKRFDTVISIDTYKSAVARACGEAGASLINDIWGLKADEKMAEVIAKGNYACCLMHNRNEAKYNNFAKDVCLDLKETLELCEKAGIEKGKIILDPGVGFAKTTDENLKVIAETEELKKLGYPLLLGTSRKSVIGNVLGVPVEERLAGTIATSVIAAMWGYAFVRVHDVKENVQAIRMTEAILEQKKQIK